MGELVDAHISLDTFFIQIYIIGGNNGNGESILILFCDEEKVIKTIAIDSCVAKINGESVVIAGKLLETYKVNKIDCFIWTHPHNDHTKGLQKLIEKYFSNSSIIVIPKQIYGGENNIVKVSHLCEKTIRFINNRFKSNNIKSIDCDVQEKRKVYTFTLQEEFSGKEIHCNVYCLTPTSYILDDIKRNEGKKLSKSELNILSISFILDIEGYYFFFGGDASDRTLLNTNNGDIKKCRWIKIPHHASSTAENFIDHLEQDIDSAVTTAFHSQKLPNTSILDKYKRRTDYVYITHKQKDKKGIGMVKYEYRFKDNDVQLTISTYGNAYQYTGQEEKVV